MKALRIGIAVGVMIAAAAALRCGICSDAPEPDYIGEFSGWGVKVPTSNYAFIRSAIVLFGTRWGEAAQTEADLDKQVWDQLVLSFEAYKRNIQITDQQVDDEIEKMLKAEKVTFDWKKEPEAFTQWVKEKTNEPVDLFRNQLKHLLQLEGLRAQVLETFKPTVSEEEAYNEFVNEYNTIDLELLQFDQLKDAEAFYKKARTAEIWDKMVAEEIKKDPKFAKHPGFVSFEFLINMWKVPKADLYKMLTMADNALYPPAPVYKGYGIFKILKKRIATKEEFPKVRDSYFKQVEMIKKYDSLNEWVKKLKEEAKITAYPRSQTQSQAQPGAQPAAAQTAADGNKTGG
ncbi:MAG TPA: hypothetical protein P5110_03350 [Candidatus Omnitrophota bacterium]|nr:hypothetical protein [Candidatus Omnitrophota bacterium]HRZ14526.1 hypothetical protein [Candidatus Omnitrophota bacterium]